MLKNFKLKAFGLVESLVAMAVFGTAILMITSLSAKSLKTVKENEIADFMNSIMVRSMEYVKSDQVTVGSPGSDFTVPLPVYFKIEGDITDSDITTLSVVDGTVVQESFRRKTNTDPGNLEDCSKTSEYLLNIDQEDWRDMIICNQLYIEPDGDNYSIISTVVYKGIDEYKINQMRGFKLVTN